MYAVGDVVLGSGKPYHQIVNKILCCRWQELSRLQETEEKEGSLLVDQLQPLAAAARYPMKGLHREGGQDGIQARYPLL